MLHASNYTTLPTSDDIDGYFHFPVYCKSLVDNAEASMRMAEDARHFRDKAGRPNGLASALGSEGLYRPYNHFMNLNSVLSERVAERILVAFIEPHIGRGHSEDYRRLQKGYERVCRFLDARRHPFQAPNTIGPHRIESIILDDFPSLTYIDQMMRDPDSFYRVISSIVEAHASSNRQPKAISLAYALCSHISNRSISMGAGLSKDKFVAYTAQIARLGGWAAQQVGQRRWLHYFKKMLFALIGTGDRVAIVSYYMLHYHDVMDHYFYTGKIPDENWAAKAYEAFISQPSGILGHIQVDDSTIFGNPTTFMVVTGCNTDDIVIESNGRSVEYNLRMAIELDAKNEFDISGYLSNIALLMRANSNGGNFEKAYSLKAEAYGIMSGVGNRLPLFAKRNVVIASGELELATTGNRRNHYLKEAKDICFQMGNLSRVAGLERRMGERI